VPQYVIIADHTPLTCPAASKRVREFAQEALGKTLPELSEKLGVKVSTMLHLDPGHKSILVLEAPNVEAVVDLSFESGFSQFNDVTVYPATPIPELVQRAQEWPTLYD
jgi:hypothetical protein